MRRLSSLGSWTKPPDVLRCNGYFSLVRSGRLLRWAAVSPGDPDPTAQGPSQAVHGVAHGAAQLLPRGQTLNVAAVPHDPTSQGQQHQEGPAVHEQVAKVPSLDLKWSKDPQKQGDDPQQVHEHGEDERQLTMGQAIIFGSHD